LLSALSQGETFVERTLLLFLPRDNNKENEENYYKNIHGRHVPSTNAKIDVDCGITDCVVTSKDFRLIATFSTIHLLSSHHASVNQANAPETSGLNINRVVLEHLSHHARRFLGRSPPVRLHHSFHSQSSKRCRTVRFEHQHRFSTLTSPSESQIPVPTSLRLSANSPQINIQRPPGNHIRQHYGYRIDQNYFLYLESILRSDSIVDPDIAYNPMSFTRRWIMQQLRLCQLDFRHCFDPERRPIVPLDPIYDSGKDLEDQLDDEDEDLFVIAVLSVCSDHRSSLQTRPTQAQIDLLTSLMGSAPQWWVGYNGWY
jgi:hypothetical protein